MGGGVMRTAAKVTSVGVAAGAALRGVSVPVEHHVLPASRKSFAPISSAVTPGDGSSVADSVQRPSSDLDEWEFAGAEEDLCVKSGQLLSRVVFGGPPTKKEAQVATMELKDALEKVYLGPSDAVDDGMSMHSLSAHSGSCVSGGISSRYMAEPPALQAFKFLTSSPEAQNVVVSIVSDENVWSAVFKNEAFVNYIEAQRGNIVSSNEDAGADQSNPDGGSKHKGNFNLSDTFSESQQSTESGSMIKGFIDSVKISVIDLANNVAEFFQNIFGGGESQKKSNDADDAKFVDMTTVGSYIMGFALMVMIVVVLKRV